MILAASPGMGGESESGVQLNARGMQMYGAGRFQDAERLYRQALENWPLNGRERAAVTANLGETLRAMGRYTEAAPQLREALRLMELTGPGTGSDFSHTLCSLAALYRTQGELTKAEQLAERATSTGREKDRNDAQLCLASIYMEEQRYAEAEALIGGMTGTAQGTSAAVLYNNLAAAANARRDFVRGEELAQRALATARQSVPERHALMATILNTLAQACRFQAKYMDAEANYRLAIEMWQEALGSTHPDVARGLMNMASFYHERSRESGAEELYRRAAAIFAGSLGEDHVESLIARNELAEVLRAEHRYVESERLSRQSLTMLKVVLPATDQRLQRALFNFALLLHETRRQKEADGILQTLRASR
ncbi:MAG TPA: tetratricopeptide repeat protein [Candidatus Sulfopaludibacter sp.]|nr:tetratricopeptide repeat protein [Candidatus Sulfopaludibacter sp.]